MCLSGTLKLRVISCIWTCCGAGAGGSSLLVSLLDLRSAVPAELRPDQAQGHRAAPARFAFTKMNRFPGGCSASDRVLQ